MTDGFKIFLSSPGGTGKIHVIKLIHRDVIYFFQKTLKPKPDQPLVLLTVPTGSAIFQYLRYNITLCIYVKFI